MHKRIATIVIASLLASSFAAGASAALVTFKFNGTVSSVFDTTGTFGAVAAGTPFSGQYTFDTAAADYNNIGSLGQYQSGGAGVGYSATVGGITFSRGSPLEIDVENNNPNQDGYYVNSQGDVTPSSAVPGASGYRSSIFLIDTSGTAVSSDALLATAPNLSAYDLNIFSVSAFAAGGGAPIFEIEGPISFIGVPEPSTILAASMLLLRRRSRHV